MTEKKSPLEKKSQLEKYLFEKKRIKETRGLSRGLAPLYKIVKDKANKKNYIEKRTPRSREDRRVGKRRGSGWG